MKILGTLVFGAGALLLATFATAAPAAAHGGISIQVGHYSDEYYDHRYNYRPWRCENRWYRRHHPYQCYRQYRPLRLSWGGNPHRYWYWHHRNFPRCYDRRPFHHHRY